MSNTKPPNRQPMRWTAVLISCAVKSQLRGSQSSH